MAVLLGAIVMLALAWLWLRLGYQDSATALIGRVSVLVWIALPTLVGGAFLIGFVVAGRPPWQVLVQALVVVGLFHFTVVSPLSVRDAQAGLAFLWLPIGGSVAALVASALLTVLPGSEFRERARSAGTDPGP